MIQQLLRGWVFYLALCAFIAALYVWPTTLPPIEPLPDAGTMAASSEAPEWWPSELDKQSVLELAAKQPHLTILFSLLMLSALAAGLAGFGLGAWAVWRGRIRTLWRFAPQRLPAWSFGELARITLLILIVALLLPFLRDALFSSQIAAVRDSHVWITASMILLDVFAILAILAFAAGKGRSVWNVLGFSRHKARSSVAVSVPGYLAVFPWIFLLLFVMAEVSHRLGMKPPMEPIQELLFQEDRPGVLWMTVLLACIVGPVAEELFFRGVVYAAVRRRTHWMVATLVSAGLFSALHTNPIGFLPIMLLGCLLANLYERTGSLAGPLVVHIAHNSFLLVSALVIRSLLGG